MGTNYESITSKLADWLGQQKVFFVATAPLSADGHVNCSPKGCDTFRIMGEREVAYLDLTGSGIETIAHVQENGRIVLMFCAFQDPPRIVRLHGHAQAIYPADPRYAPLRAQFGDFPSARAVILIGVTRISDSCGFGVPLMEFVAERDRLGKWAGSKTPDELATYRARKNETSIDGIQGYRVRG